MRRSEFDRAVADEFGGRGSAVVHDLGLTGLAGRTAADALAVGVPTREVWLALCDEADVPATRRYGVGQIDRRN